MLAGRSSRRVAPAAATYLGAGAVEAVRQQLLVLGSTPGEPAVQGVFVNAALTAVQERNLCAQLGLPVLDRVQLIIRIFAQRARSKEARLQVGAGPPGCAGGRAAACGPCWPCGCAVAVAPRAPARARPRRSRRPRPVLRWQVELAQLNHRLSRLVRAVTKAGRGGFGAGGRAGGELEVVSARQRGVSGGRGMGGGGGPGETELALQRSRIVKRRAALERQVEEVGREQAGLAGWRRAGPRVVPSGGREGRGGGARSGGGRGAVRGLCVCVFPGRGRAAGGGGEILRSPPLVAGCPALPRSCPPAGLDAGRRLAAPTW
jgi:hypothetical protein